MLAAVVNGWRLAAPWLRLFDRLLTRWFASVGITFVAARFWLGAVAGPGDAAAMNGVNLLALLVYTLASVVFALSLIFSIPKP